MFGISPDPGAAVCRTGWVWEACRSMEREPISEYRTKQEQYLKKASSFDAD
jgi:hypothetical protein